MSVCTREIVLRASETVGSNVGQSTSSTAAKDGRVAASSAQHERVSVASRKSQWRGTCGRSFFTAASCTASGPGSSGQGGSPWIMLYTMREKEYTSTGVPYFSCRYTSGAMKRYEPVSPVRRKGWYRSASERAGAPPSLCVPPSGRSLASPKSATLSVSAKSSSRLACAACVQNESVG